MTSGYIAIAEPITEVNDDIYDYYMAIVDELAERNGLSGAYKSPLWSVGFVWG